MCTHAISSCVHTHFFVCTHATSSCVHTLYHHVCVHTHFFHVYTRYMIMCTHAISSCVHTHFSCVHILHHHVYTRYTIMYFCMCREWKKPHVQSETDTDDTAEEDNVGGYGKYSRGYTCLAHQHWVEQIKSAGSLRVHDTEAAEGYHKLCMKQCSHRVRHQRQNRTQQSMLKYLCRRNLFEVLMQNVPDQMPRTYTKKEGMHLRVLLLRPSCVTNEQVPVTMGYNLASIASQRQFLHPEARIARVELMDLLCDQLSLPRTRTSYQKMNALEWTFGQHLVIQNGTAYWATDSRYTSWTSENRRRRRDILLLRGTEQTRVRQADGNLVLTRTAYCCETVCFVTVSNINRLDCDIPAIVQQDIVDGALTHTL